MSAWLILEHFQAKWTKARINKKCDKLKRPGRFSEPISRIEPRLDPWRAQVIAPEMDAVMQPERPVMPELHDERNDTVAAPIRGAGHGADDIFCGESADRLFEREPVLQGRRLPAGPGADL